MSNTRKHTRMRALHLSIKATKPLTDFPSILKEMDLYKRLVTLKRAMPKTKKTKIPRRVLACTIYKSKLLLGIKREPNKICCVRYTDVLTQKGEEFLPGLPNDQLTTVASLVSLVNDIGDEFISSTRKKMVNGIGVPSAILGYNGISTIDQL